MVAFFGNKGVDLQEVMELDVISFVSLHDRMVRHDLRRLSDQTRLSQIASQADGKQLDKALKPIDDLTGATKKREQDDLAKLKGDLQKGTMK